MKIGIDFDDVLYYTSKMIFDVGPKYLSQHNVDYEIDETQYDTAKLFNISPVIDSELWINAFETHNPIYLVDNASVILRMLKTRFGGRFEIVSSRPDTNAEYIHIRQLITHMEPSFDFDAIHLGIIDKATFLTQNGFDIHIDDHPCHISALQNTTITPIMTNFESTRHNKFFASTYDGYIMTHWSDLPQIFEKIMAERSSHI